MARSLMGGRHEAHPGQETAADGRWGSAT
jgi:hypothetical protein